jgi:DNA-binding transcriptional LysR family regulator
VKLLLRTTRKLSLTFEGSAFLEDCQRILNDLANAEASVSLGGSRPAGISRCRRRPDSGGAMWRRWSGIFCAPMRT